MRPHGKKSKVDRILKLKRPQEARLIIYPGMQASEDQFTLSRSDIVRERLVAQSKARHLRPTSCPGRPNCDTSFEELCIIDLVAQHNPGTNQKFSSYGDFRFAPVTMMQEVEIEALEFIVVFDRDAGRLNQQEAEQARASFRDAPPTHFVG